MKGILQLLFPDQDGEHGRIALAVKEGGGELKRFRTRREMLGLQVATIEIMYAEPFLPSILACLGSLPGVSIQSFRPRVGRSGGALAAHRMRVRSVTL